jgi:prepilin-type N-terminal cleavage/methylation domain-containing protein
MATSTFKQLGAKRLQRGFTLIEALLVAILVGLLASVAVLKLSGARGDAVDVARMNFIESLNLNIQRAAMMDKPFNGAAKADFSAEDDPAASAFLALLDDLSSYGFYTQFAFDSAERILLDELNGTVHVNIYTGSVITTNLLTVEKWGVLEVRP